MIDFALKNAFFIVMTLMLVGQGVVDIYYREISFLKYIAWAVANVGILLEGYGK